MKGWLYLAAVKDLHTCEIVGWAMEERMTKQLVCDALRAAYWRKKPSAGLMHHSDRGSQYCSKIMRQWSFFGTLKIECLHHHKFKTRAKAKHMTFEYIEVFYNRIRRHTKINNQIPADFTKTCMEKLDKNAA